MVIMISWHSCFILLFALLLPCFFHPVNLQDNNNCNAFVIDLTQPKVLCILYNLSVPPDGESFVVKWIRSASGKATFRKICISGVSANCRSVSTWSYESVPGWRVKPEQTTRLQHVRSMEHCMELCAKESNFVCRSVSYSRRTKNCELSRYDRRSASPGAYFQGDETDIYIEFLCAEDIKSGCDFSQVSGLAMLYTWHIEENVQSDADCMSRCVELQIFICRGYVWNSADGSCSMSAEDTFAMLSTDQSAGNPLTYKQRRDCIEAEVSCTPTEMFVIFKLNREFNGKVFAVDAMDTCTFDIANQFQFRLTLPNENATRSQCAIMEEQKNPSVFSTTMMLQYHDMVFTGMDRMFKLMCTFKAREQSVTDSVELKSPTASPSAFVVQGGSEPPEAFLRIVNGQNRAVTTAELHENLYAEIVLKPENGPPSEYALFINNCEAFTEKSRMLLIDEFGCPTDTNVFEGFTLKPNSNGRIVWAAFRGFRFETDSKVNLNCNVNFCYQFCEPVLCIDKHGRRIQSYGRKKRLAAPLLRREISQNFVAKETVHGEIFVEMSPRSFVSNTTSIEKYRQISHTSSLVLLMIITTSTASMTVCFSLAFYLWIRRKIYRLNKRSES